MVWNDGCHAYAWLIAFGFVRRLSLDASYLFFSSPPIHSLLFFFLHPVVLCPQSFFITVIQPGNAGGPLVYDSIINQSLYLSYIIFIMLNTSFWLSGLLLAAAASAHIVETYPAIPAITVTVTASTVTVAATGSGSASNLPSKSRAICRSL